MNKRTCKTCEEYARLRLRAAREGIRVETERPVVFICENCTDVRRFVLFGPAPKTRREVDQLARDLKLRLGLSKLPGPKADRPTLLEIDSQILKNEEWASLKHIAEQMGVKPHAIQKVIKEAMGVTFKKYQALLFQNLKKSGDKSRLSMRKLKKSRRKF